MAEMMVDADGHVLEPRDLWSKRTEKRFLDRVPRVVRDPDGYRGEHWVIEGLRPMSAVAGGFAGEAKDMAEYLEFAATGRIEDCRPGGWDGAERLKDLERDGISAGVLYPTAAAQLYGVLDPELQSALMRVYNDWLAEVCAYDPKRLTGVAMIPSLDPALSAAEVRRAAELGHRAALISVSQLEGEGYRDPAWDVMWAAFDETDVLATFHTFNGNWWWPQAHEDRNIHLLSLTQEGPLKRVLVEIIFWGALDRFPGLRLVMAEFRLGWLPAFIDFMDDRFKNRHHWNPMPKRLPSEYWHERMWAGMVDEPMLMGEAIDFLGHDRLMWSSDYPHIESTWPNSREAVEVLLRGVSPDARRRITRNNAAELYGMVPPS